MKEYSKLGLDIVAETLNYGLNTMCNFVKGNQKPRRIRAVLNLLASMIAQGSGAARDVFSKVNIAGPNFVHLMSKSNPYEEEEDIRALFLNLIVLLFNVGDNGLIRQIVDTKGFLNRIFPNVMYDKADIIVLVLKTFSSKVLNNPTIMKTSKIRLFNDFTLKYILELYRWSGPLRPRQFLKRKLGDDDALQPMKATHEEITSVRETAHAFMMTLCCSYKHGIIFRDLTYGTSGRNQNHIITNLLKPFMNPYSDPFMSELVISVLKTCPDQMKYYLVELKVSFLPRLSPQWLKAIDFIKKIIQAQDCVHCLFGNEEGKKTIAKLVSVFKVICVPEVISNFEFLETLEKLHPYVCYQLLDYLLCMLKQVKAVIDYSDTLHAGNVYSLVELRDFHFQCIFHLLTVIPGVKDLEKYWYRITSLSASNLDHQVEDIQGFEMPSATALLAQVLDLFNIYGKLFYEYKAFENTDATFYKLFTGLIACKLQLRSDDISSLQFKLMNFFAFESSLKKAGWNERLGFPLFSFVLHSYMSMNNFKLATKIEKHIFKLIKNSTSFDGELWEIAVWTRQLKFQKKYHSEILVKFLTDVVHSLSEEQNLVHPIHSTELLKSETEGTVMQRTSSGRGNGFSNLVSAALFHLRSVSDKVYRKYVQCVINHIFHRQLQPKILLSLVRQYKELFSSSQFRYWEFLCNIDQAIEVPERTKSESLNIALQDAFALFHSTSNKESQTSDIYFCHLTDKIEELCYGEIHDLMWQLLTYMRLEAEKLFVTAAYVTAIPSYVHLLQALITYGETFEKGEKMPEDNSSNICGHYSEINNWMYDILTHPVITKCFLPLNATFSQCNDDMVLAIQTVSDFVFEFVKSRPICDKSEILMPLKNAAVSFCASNIVPQLCDDARIDYKWRVFAKTVTVFASVISANEAVLLLDHLLSLEDSLFEKLDRKCSVFSMLIQIYGQQAKDLLLPRKTLKILFTKAVQPKPKKKRALIMKENVMKLLKLHPSYALDFPRRALQTLMEQWSVSNLEILDALIMNNTSVLKNIQAVVTSYLNSKSVNDESFLFHVIVRCLKAKFDAEKDGHFLQSVHSFLWAYICRVLISDASHELKDPFSFDDVPYVVNLMVQNNVIDKDGILTAVRELRDGSAKIPHVSKIATLLKLLECWFNISSLSSELSPVILNLLISWIECALQTLQYEDRDNFLSYVLNLAQICIQGVDTTVVKGVFSDPLKWHSFVQNCLKVALKDVSVGVQLITFLNAFIEKLYSTPMEGTRLKSFKEEISKIYNLLSSHSNFCAVLLDDSGQYKLLKGCVVQLLITLVQMNSSICRSAHIPVFLASYNATLSDIDQKLLCLLKIYEDNDIDFSNYSPFMWGTAAISHYSLLKKEKYSLWRQPKMQEVLGLFQRDLLTYTLQNFPLNLGLKPVPTTCFESGTDTVWERVYDPRFVLPLLSVILSPGAYVNCRGFIESNVLSVIFGSLSSCDVEIRALGYYCLAQFYSHLESSNYGQSKIWVSLLDSVRNSIDGSNPRMPSIITLFLSKAVNILINPGNSMYVAIYKFLMAKPNLDLGQVPEFYKLFNSIEIEHRLQRNWILTLLEEGLRTSLDFHICQKRYIFTILLPYYCSSLANEQEKIKILQIILSVVKIYSSARTMCQSGLLTWMHNVINLSNESEILKLISKIMDTLWATCKPSTTEDASIAPLYSSFPTEFQLVHLSLLKKLALLKH